MSTTFEKPSLVHWMSVRHFTKGDLSEMEKCVACVRVSASWAVFPILYRSLGSLHLLIRHCEYGCNDY
jgi:hypothetical protein